MTITIRRLASIVGFSLALLMSISAGPAQAQPQVTLEYVDIIDANNQAAWWSPIIHDPVEDATYLIYNLPHEVAPGATTTDDHVYIANRDSSGTWTKADTGGRAPYDPGHNQGSLAMDGDGFLHAFYGMHNHPMRYRVSNASRSISGGFTYNSFQSGSFTYPNLTTTPTGDVYMIIRDGRDGQLYHFNNQTNNWSHVDEFAAQSGTTVYPDHVFADSVGDLHLVWEWAAGGPQASRHYGSYARYNPVTGKYFRADGSEYAAGPINIASADIFQSLEGSETFESRVHGFQSAKMTLDDQNRPVITYAYSTDGTGSGYQHRVARWGGSAWDLQVVEPGPFTTDKSWITFSDGVLRYYGTVSEDDPLHTGSDDIFLRTSEDDGQTWSDPIAITVGMDIQRPVGTTVDGIDYLYLPSVSGESLYFAEVVTPEPASLWMFIVGALAMMRRTPRALPSGTEATSAYEAAP